MQKGPFEKKYRALLRQEPRAYESTFYNLFDRSSVYRPNDGLPRGVYNPKPSIFADSPLEASVRKQAEQQAESARRQAEQQAESIRNQIEAQSAQESLQESLRNKRQGQLLTAPEANFQNLEIISFRDKV